MRASKIVALLVCSSAAALPWPGPAESQAVAPSAARRLPARTPCEQAVIDEAEAVHRRIHALAAEAADRGPLDAARRARMGAAVVDVTLDVPTMFVFEHPERFRALLDAKDQLLAGEQDAEARSAIARVLGQLDAGYTSVLMSRSLYWSNRCEAHPDWNRAPPPAAAPVGRAAGRRATAWLAPAFARATACSRLVQRVLHTPVRGRSKFRGQLAACNHALNRANALCEARLAPLSRTMPFPVERAAKALQALEEIHRPVIPPTRSPPCAIGSRRPSKPPCPPPSRSCPPPASRSAPCTTPSTPPIHARPSNGSRPR